MSKFDKITDAMTNVVGPFAKAVSDNNAISALTQGFMYTMPVTLGVAAIAVLVNLPIAPWTAFLQSTGLYNAGTEVVSLTLSLLAIYVVGAIAYSYTHIRKQNEMIGLIMAMGSFLILIPIYNAVDPTTNSTIATIKTSYLGSDGIFVAFIVGRGSAKFKKELINKIKELNLNNIVNIVEDYDIPTMYALSDVVVNASIVPESFGLTILEASAMGRPVVATNHGGATEIILDGITGKLVEPCNSDALKDGIQWALSLNEEERKNLSIQAIKHANFNFSRVSKINQTIDVYLSLMNK